MEDSDRYKSELKTLEDAIIKEPNNPDNHNDKANILVKMGLNNEAIKEYEIAIKLDPEIAGYYYNKGIAMQNLKNNVGAIIAYEKGYQGTH